MKRIQNSMITVLTPRSAIVLAALFFLSCAPEAQKSRDAMPTKDIKTVMDAHVQELMALPGVTAVAIGALDDGSPCIKVYVVKSTKEIKRRIPETLDGYPVVIETSGEIRALGDDS